MTRSLLLIAVGLFVTLGTPGPVVAAGPEPVASGELELVPGAEGKIVTVLEGNRTTEIPATYLGTYHDFSGPGYDLHLVQLEGPEAERVGVAAGMSGSPVYFDGKLIGALSYRLGRLPKTAVGGVTPIGDILDAARAEPGAGLVGEGIAPIATPVVAGGLSGGAREWLSPLLADLGFVLAAGGGTAGGTGGSHELGPGSPVGAELVRGDLRIAATGTVTRVEGDRVYAFGHPFLGTGRVELPMVAAEVIHTLADLAGSVKLVNVGAELGAIVEDRHAAIIGRLGQQAKMIPVRLTLRGGDHGERPFRFEVTEHQDLAPVLSAVSVLTALQTDPGYSQTATLMARGRVRMEGLPDLPLEMAFSGSGGSDPSVALASELMAILGVLWRNPFAPPRVLGIQLSVEARREVTSYRLESLQFDRAAVVPGDTIDIRCVLRPFRGEPVERTMALTLPETLPDSDRLVLIVGNPRALDVALGNVLTRRIQSATDPEAYVQVLADFHSPHRLEALIVDKGGAVISGGGSFVQLPPTAERLLATQTRQSRSRTVAVSPIAGADRG